MALNNRSAAISAARQALDASPSVKTRFVAARMLAAAGETGEARKLGAALAAELKPEPQSYAKLLQASVELQAGNSAQAVTLASQAVSAFDTWIAHFELGRAYLAAQAFPQADSEFEQCLKRRGEAVELFMDDAATYRYVAPVYYFQGRVREGMRSSGAEPYGKYLEIRGKAAEDPLLAEVRRKLGR